LPPLPHLLAGKLLLRGVEMGFVVVNL